MVPQVHMRSSKDGSPEGQTEGLLRRDGSGEHIEAYVYAALQNQESTQ